MRQTKTTKVVISAVAAALLATSAHAQEMGMGKGKKHQQDTQKPEDKTKKKADEKAYKDALKSVPASGEKLDPWKSLR
jgi:hypothetical protein